MNEEKRYYSTQEIRSDYDKGYTLDQIAEWYKASQLIDYQNKISSKRHIKKYAK